MQRNISSAVHNNTRFMSIVRKIILCSTVYITTKKNGNWSHIMNKIIPFFFKIKVKKKLPLNFPKNKVLNRKAFLLYICKQIRQNISILCYHLFRIQGFVSSSYEFKRFLSLPLQHYQHSLSEILYLFSFWRHKLRNVSKFCHNHKNHHSIAKIEECDVSQI